MNSETFRKNIKQILIPEADLQAKIKEVGAQISKEYDGKPLLLVSILNGAFVFWQTSAVPSPFPVKLLLCVPKATTAARFPQAL